MPLSAELIGQGLTERSSTRDSRQFLIWDEFVRKNGDFFIFITTLGYALSAFNRQIMKFTVSGLYQFDITLTYAQNPPSLTTLSIVNIEAGNDQSDTLVSQEFHNTLTINARFMLYIYEGDEIAVWLTNTSSTTVSPIRIQGVSDAPIMRIVALSQLYSTYVGDASVIRGTTLTSIPNATLTPLSLGFTAAPFIPSYLNSGALLAGQDADRRHGSNALGGWESLDPSKVEFPITGTYFINAQVTWSSTGSGATARWLVLRNQNNKVIACKTVDAYTAVERAINVSVLFKAQSLTDSVQLMVYQNSGTSQDVPAVVLLDNPAFYSLSAVYIG